MIKIAQSNEEINSKGGNILLFKSFSHLSLEKFNQVVCKKVKRGQYANKQIIETILYNIASGQYNFANVARLNDDAIVKHAVNLNTLPSEETLRQRFDDIALHNENQSFVDSLIIEQLKMVKDLGKIETEHLEYIPMDLDVSIMEQPNCKKEGVSWTYHEVMGYAPIFCYLGTNAYMLGNELRNGSQHSVPGTNEFIQRCFDKTDSLDIKRSEILLRADSGHDDKNFLKLLNESGVKYLIKRNFRNEDRTHYIDNAIKSGVKIEEKHGKTRYLCTLSHVKPEGCEEHPMFLVLEVTLTTQDDKGELFLLPEVELSGWWTNLTEDEITCISLYHDHATSEQYHSELKTDLYFETLPSGKFKSNALLLNLSTLVYNALRLIGQIVVKSEHNPVKNAVSRLRLRTVLLNLIYVGCKVVKHANQIIVKFGKSCSWYKCIEEAFHMLT